MPRSFRTLIFAFFCLFLTPIPSHAADKASGVSKEAQLLTEISQEFQRHNYKKVIHLYRDFSDENPDRSPPLIAKIFYSQALADTGNLDDAIKSLKEILTDLPPQADPLRLQYDLANLFFIQRRFDEAKILYQKMLLGANQHQDLLTKAKERIAVMKDKDANSKKKDFVSLQLLDIETALEAGEVPDAAVALLQQIAEQNPTSPQAEQVRRLQNRVKEVRTERAKTLLEEARRLFDVEKKYTEVREFLDEIIEKYSDVCEMPSVEALSKEVDQKLKGKN